MIIFHKKERKEIQMKFITIGKKFIDVIRVTNNLMR